MRKHNCQCSPFVSAHCLTTSQSEYRHSPHFCASAYCLFPHTGIDYFLSGVASSLWAKPSSALGLGRVRTAEWYYISHFGYANKDNHINTEIEMSVMISNGCKVSPEFWAINFLDLSSSPYQLDGNYINHSKSRNKNCYLDLYTCISVGGDIVGLPYGHWIRNGGGRCFCLPLHIINMLLQMSRWKALYWPAYYILNFLNS